MPSERNGIRAEELVIYVAIALIGGVRVIIQVASGEVWGGGATLGLALVVLGLIGLVGRRPFRRRKA